MGRKRKTIPFNKKAHGDDLLDCVTLGDTKPYYVIQENGEWPPYAEVIASRVVNRDPRLQDEDARFLRALAASRRPMTFTAPPFTKYCGHCGEWVSKLEFGDNRSTHDGLQKWCKPCANRHARRMYYLAKEAQKLAA